MKRVINKVKSDKSLWKAIRLRFFTICAAFSVMWVITGSPVTSVGLTAAQQSVSFGVHYLFEKNEEQEVKQVMKEVKRKEDAELHKEFMKHFKE